MQGHLFLIRTLTNLHVGSGDTDFGVVDKQVQRDAITNFPSIYSSSLKGALRQHFEVVENKSKYDEFILHVFGSPVRDDEDKKEDDKNGNEPKRNKKRQGDYRFLSAELLSIPQPCEDDNPNIGKPFQRVTSFNILKQFAEKADKLNVKAKAIKNLSKLNSNENSDRIDSNTFIHEFFNKVVEEPFKDNFTAFDELAKELPVLARNHLDNGESQNLWYEEFVPRESVFGLVVLASDNETYFKDFKDALNGKIVQLGGNATVGYGLCLFTYISETK